MDRDKIEHAVMLAQLFIMRAAECLDNDKVQYSKESAALRRQSMELTRALADLRGRISWLARTGARNNDGD